MKKLTVIIILLLLAVSGYVQRVDFSVVFVPEESGNNITRISNAGDYVCLPIVMLCLFWCLLSPIQSSV